MNRRNVIRGLVACTAAFPALTALPALPAAKDSETVKRDVIRGLLVLSDQESFELGLLRVAMCEGHSCRAYALELLESGIPVAEVQQRVGERVNFGLYGPEVLRYTENGMKVGGGSLDWRERTAESKGGAA